MKTRSISKKTHELIGSAKTICLLILFLLSLIPIRSRAQLAVVSGTGMSNCTSYSFGIAGSTSLTPLNYGNQYFQCSGVNKDDISFNQQGNGWRVQKSLFSYIPNTSCSYATLDGVDGWNATINTVTISPNDVVLPCCYQVSNGVNCVQFTINGTTQPGIYDRSNWVIWTY